MFNRQNRPYIGLGFVFILAISLAVAYHLSTPKMAAMTTSTGTTASTTPAVATNMVTLANYAFSPAHITVKVGTTVTWMNTDDVDHTVTVDSGTGPSTMLFGRGMTESYTFTKAGTYHYHCMPHPYMHGIVTVTS